MKFATNVSTITQPCDTGDLHKRELNHAKRISMADTPTNSIINPLAEQLQDLRDTRKFNVFAKTTEHIFNSAIRIPTVFRKSCDPKSNLKAHYTPGILDQGQQGPDLDVMMATCEKKLPIELKKRCLKEIPELMAHMRPRGRIIEEELEVRNHPVDTDSDGIEHPLS